MSDESILFYSISIKMVSFFYCFVTALLVDISSGFQSSCPHNSRCTSQKPWLNYFSGLASATTSETPHTNDSIAKGRSLPSTPPSSNEFNVDYEAYGNGYKTVFSELPFSECKASHGLIPKDLRGSYYRCGPAMYSAGSILPPKASIIQPRDGAPVPDGQNPKRMVRHPFEADGGVLGVTFGNETVTARFRYVRTIAFTNERRKGQRLYNAMDSTRDLGYDIAEGIGNEIHTPLFRHHLQPGLSKKRKNTSNTRVIYWGKKLLSLWEGGQPYKLDSLALSTEGRSQLGGVLSEQDPFGSKLVIDPIKDRAIMYRVIPDAKSSELTIFEFDNNFRLVEDGDEGKITIDLPGLALLSDLAATANYIVFVQPAVSTSMQFMFGKEPGKVLSVEKSPATLYLIPRVGSNKEQLSVEIPFDGVVDANLQICNAYEEENKVVFDAIRSDGLDKVGSTKPSISSSLEWPFVTCREDYDTKASNKSLWRYTIDLSSGVASKRKLSDQQCFFGSVQPKQVMQKHDHIYLAVGGLGDSIAPPQGIARFNCKSESLDSWIPKEYEFCGEPMFAPKVNPKTEDDGYVLSVLFNGKSEQSELLVFESSEISPGPLCRIPLGMGIPHGLHGCFADSEEAIWSFGEIQRRSKLADKIESRGNRWNEVKSDFSGLGLRFDDMEEYFGDSFLS